MWRATLLALIGCVLQPLSYATAHVTDDLLLPGGATLFVVLERSGYDCGTTSRGIVCTGGGEVWACDGTHWTNKCEKDGSDSASRVDHSRPRPGGSPVEVDPGSNITSLPLTVKECLGLGGTVELHASCQQSGVKCTTRIDGVERALCIDTAHSLSTP